MATYTSTNALTIAKKFVRDAPVGSIDAESCDMVNSIMWTYYPWNWARAALTAIPTSDGVQDFAIDAGNTNIARILTLRLIRTDTTPDEYHDIDVRDFLPPDLTKASMYNMTCAAYEPISNKIRLERAIDISGSATVTINGEYWKDPTKIVDAGLGSAVLFPDRYFCVFVEGVKWQLMQFANDARAGDVQINSRGDAIYTGQWGIFMALLEQMARAEDYGDIAGEFPSTPIGDRVFGSRGFYG